MEKVIMEGGLCKIVEERVLFECKSEDFMDQYRNTIPIKTGLMPRNIFYYFRNNYMKSIMVVEHSPRMVKIKWKPDREGPTTPYRIALPFIYYVFYLNEKTSLIKLTMPCCTKRRIKSLGDPVFTVPLANIYESRGPDGVRDTTNSGHFCTGEIKTDTKMPMNERVDYMIDEIFNTTWNNDLHIAWPKEIEGKFELWASKSMKNGLFWNDITYNSHAHKTLNGIIKVLFEGVYE